MTGQAEPIPAPGNLVDKMVDCPALVALAAISGKWKTRILWHLRGGEAGFNDLRRALRGVSAKVLSEQLAQLVADGLVSRHEDQAGAVMITRYDYTAQGRSLVPALDALGEWGLAHRQGWVSAPSP